MISSITDVFVFVSLVVKPHKIRKVFFLRINYIFRVGSLILQIIYWRLKTMTIFFLTNKAKRIISYNRSCSKCLRLYMFLLMTKQKWESRRHLTVTEVKLRDVQRPLGIFFNTTSLKWIQNYMDICIHGCRTYQCSTEINLSFIIYGQIIIF